MDTALALIVYILVLVAVIGFGYGLYRRKGGVFTGDAPDHLGEEIVTGLMAELRKSQAETAYWKSTAERLQHEADER